MNLTLTYIWRNAAKRQIWLSDGQSVTVGKSRIADFCVEDDERLAPVHFRIALGDSVARVVSASDGSIELRLNGQPILDAKLSDGDVLQAGNCQFKIALESEPDVAPATKVVRPTVVSKAAVESGMVEVRVATREVPLAPLLAWLDDGNRRLLCVNRRRAERSRPDSNEVASRPVDDLLTMAPPEIRNSDSLEIEEPMDHAACALRWGEFSQRDASILVATPLSAQDFIQSRRFVLAWFVRPSILTQQFRNGSLWLASQLTQACDWLATESDGGDLSFFAKAGRAEGIADRLRQLELTVPAGSTPSGEKSG